MIPAPAMSVALSTSKAAAKPVAITLRLHYEMQCGWPGPGSLELRFPAGMLPAKVREGAVLVNGRSAPLTESHGELAVGMPKRPQIMCDAIGPGVLTVTFTRAAGIGNPEAAGSYVLRATHASDRFTGRIAITR